MNRPTFNLPRWDDNVEHFMDQNELDNLAGRVAAIENFMNANICSPRTEDDICKSLGL